MKRLILLLPIVLIVAMANSANTDCIESNPETLIITEVNPSTVPGEQTEYEISLLCPKCHKIMYAKFKKGYTSSTVAKCEKCYQRYVIKYNWPSDHKEPTIREIKESK